MKPSSLRAITLLTILALIIPTIAGCLPAGGAEKVESYLAIAPLILQAGTREAVSITLLNGERLVTGDVELTLLNKDNKPVVTVKERIPGKGTIPFDVPLLPDKEYTLRIKGDGFQDEGKVQVANTPVVFLETDKPIYKPGQTILMRVITLNSELRPVTSNATVEILDAKGIKIFRKIVKTDDFGMASLELPLSNEPNLGTWKISAEASGEKAQLDVRVEKYVLPKYEVKLELEKEWFLVNERIKGQVSAEYSFGKPVSGELTIKAKKYVGQWQEYATFTKKIDGTTDFELPEAGYVAGVPGVGGQGNVQLEVTVEEKVTGYSEKTTKLLTISQSDTNIEIIPASIIFKPGLPFSFLVVTETPDNKLKEASLQVKVTSIDKDYKTKNLIEKNVKTDKGKAVIDIIPPGDAVAMTIECSGANAYATRAVTAGYSPTGSFIHVEQVGNSIPKVGEEVKFQVHATKEAANFYYEIVSRGKVVYSSFTGNNEITIKTTPLMAPSSRLLVYQILPNSEVAADYIPFKVTGDYPQNVKVTFSQDETEPGGKVDINIQTEGEAKVGLAAVDRSVFILAENRMNLQQVFDELEKLYMKPQAELHEVTIYPSISTQGANEVFRNAQVLVLSSSKIPEGKEYQSAMPGAGGGFWPGLFMRDGAEKGIPVPMPVQAPQATSAPTTDGLAEVQRVRQYFPETWLWQEVTTNALGRGSLSVTAPDSITTWMLRAVALSKSKGLGITEDELRVFQPFFLSIDLPYSAIRGEEFPVRIAVYNYLNKSQQVKVELEKADWFTLLEGSDKTVNIGASDIGGVEFKIRADKLGTNEIKVTARSPEMADAVVKTVIIEAEGVPKEIVDNVVLSAGGNKVIATSLPPFMVPDSGRAYVSVTSSFLTQTIDGLEGLIQMPFGCGEQNMIVFAPDVYITNYLKSSNQLKPEIMAKAEKLMITGYQRELTYRRSDGSFSAFGQSDQEGSLWLTAFVLKCFAQAKGLMYIDDNILANAAEWIKKQQKGDGSFEAVGFVHHQEMMGGLKGKDALTAYVAAALLIAGEKDSSARAVSYLEGKLPGMDDPYAVALTAYILELAKSGKRNEAYDKLMKLAIEDENGLHWGNPGVVEPTPLPGQPKEGIRPMPMPIRDRSAEIENTAYAVLALNGHGDALNASRAAKWLVSKRNAYGGYGSTQDTVVTLQALTEFATNTRADVDLKVKITAGKEQKELRINSANYDTLQIVAVPVGEDVTITSEGKGEAIAQVVRRFNIPEAPPQEEVLKVVVDYDTTQVAVDDIVKVTASLEFNPPVPAEAGMIVLDISVPTGFTPVTESIDAAVARENRIKRYDIAGRKVIFYIENMKPGEKVSLSFNVKALYPVKAKGVTSQAYSYYKPEIKGETLSKDVTVVSR